MKENALRCPSRSRLIRSFNRTTATHAKYRRILDTVAKAPETPLYGQFNEQPDAPEASALGAFSLSEGEHLVLNITDLSDVDDPHLLRILEQRFEQFAEYGCSIGELARFYVVRPEDDVTEIMSNLVDGSAEPSWEWVEDHGGWFEAPIIMSDDGFGHVYFIPDRDYTNPKLLFLCRRDASKRRSMTPR